VTVQPQSHIFQANIGMVILRNGGANDIVINFGQENFANNFWVLVSRDGPLRIAVSRGTKINYKSVGGTSQLEMILCS